MTKSVRVLLVDDHRLFREGLARLLDEEVGIEVTGQCGTVEEAIHAVRELQPDVVLLDVDLAGNHGGEFLRLKPTDCACRVLLVTAGTDCSEIARLLDGGANGVFSKGTESKRLPEAIARVAAGGMWVDEEFVKPLIHAAAENTRSSALPPRDQRILESVRLGRTNKEIAEELGVSEPVVKAALQRLFQRFGVSNRAQLAASTLPE